MTRALVVGRFQPFHLGHLALVKHALTLADEVVLVVGSAEESHAPDDPFTAGERVEMIRATLREEGVLDRAVVVPVPDLHRNALWVHHVRQLVPSFDLVLTNNPLPRLLFEEAGYRVEPFELTKRRTWEGEAIREAMRSGGDWRSALPAPVAALAERFRGPERLRALAATDRESAALAQDAKR